MIRRGCVIPLRALFSRIGIVKKMVIGYFIIVFVPVIVFGLYYYNQLYASVIEEYAGGKQQIIEQAYSNLRMDLLQLESNYGLFQYNSNVIDYLNGVHQYEGEYVYFFQKHISPLLSYALSGNSNTKAIRIYKNNEHVFTVPELIMPRKDLPLDLRTELGLLMPGRGKWFYNLSDLNEWSLVYYQNMYAERFSKQVGVLTVEVDQRLIQGFEETLSNEGRSEILLFPGDFTSTPPGATEDLMTKIREKPSDYFFLNNKRLIVNHLMIDELGIRVAVVSQAEDVFVRMADKKMLIIMSITGLLLLLSGMYYLLASSVTKRLLRLARHMRNVGEDNFRIMDHREDQDEIGYLTYTYNLMLQRMDELVNRIQRSELLRKEAAYKILQAQVKPHFLYNTLETIRMLAETNEDREVADIAFSFGQLMRYSLSKQNEEVKLSDEVKNINHYMNIHKMRLGKRLEYSIEMNTDVKHIPCPQFILQPLVENCIVHGLSTTRRFCRVDICIDDDEQYVYIDISDNGVGIPNKRLEMINQVLNNIIDIKDFSTDDGGQGLYNVSERIKAFYGEDSRIEIESKESIGTTLKLYLNKKGMFKHVEAAGSR
jgi:two-component system sensor histidine kinase YesM